MGDTHPLTSNDFVLMDVGDGSSGATELNTDGNIPRSRKTGILSPYNVNGRLIVITLAIVCFLLSLALFIGTVVVYNGHSRGKDCLLPTLTDQKYGVWPAGGNMEGGKWKEVQQGSAVDASGKQGHINTMSVTKVNGKNVEPGKLVFSEEFDNFDTENKWQHLSHDPSNHFYHYVNTRNNSYVKDGILYLKPTFTDDAYGKDYVYNGTLFLGRYPSEKCKNTSALCWKNADLEIVHPIMTPMVSSQETFSFRYGRLVIKAKMPGGDWIEPLMTLQPNDTYLYGDGLLSGQIQMIDIRGNRKLFNADHVNVGSEQTCPDVRFGSQKTKRILYDCLSTKEDEGWDRGFHLYEIEWTPHSLILKIDGEGIIQAPNPRKSMFDLWSRGRFHRNPWAEHSENDRMAPFDREFYIVLGMNVGGTNGFFSDEYEGPYPKPWKNDDTNAAKEFWEKRHLWEPSWKGDSAAMQIDYIHLYSLNQTEKVD